MVIHHCAFDYAARLISGAPTANSLTSISFFMLALNLKISLLSLANSICFYRLDLKLNDAFDNAAHTADLN